MRTVEMVDATGPLSDYARRVRRGPIVVTVKGKPIAVLTKIGSQTDLENILVSNDPGFKALIARSRRLHPPGTGLTSDEVRKRLGIPRRKARR